MSVEHRRGRVLVTVLDARGEPVADTDVVVEQTRHDFAFGNIGFDFIPLAASAPSPTEQLPVERSRDQVEPSPVERSRDQFERSRDLGRLDLISTGSIKERN